MPWAGLAKSSREGKGLTESECAEYVENTVFRAWKPNGTTLHNTGAPNLKQAMSTPPAQRILNLERYYRDEQGWSSGPHFFLFPYPNGFWPFTPLNVRGTHSPSWNGTKVGVELVGDYRPGVDDPRSGPGLIVYRHAVALFGMLHAKLGLDPETITFHRDDPRTSHRCPGDTLYGMKGAFIDAVQEYMGTGGDHTLEDEEQKLPVTSPSEGTVVAVDGLNLRAESSASSKIIDLLPLNQRVAVLGEPVLNGSTRWFRVWARVDGVERVGWVAARYVKMD